MRHPVLQRQLSGDQAIRRYFQAHAWVYELIRMGVITPGAGQHINRRLLRKIKDRKRIIEWRFAKQKQHANTGAVRL